MNGYYYIPIHPDSKRPVVEFGGWPIDPSLDAVCTLQEVEESEHSWWAVVGHKSTDFLVIDIDLYKMSDAEKAEVNTGWFDILDDTRVVKTPSGGLHVYVHTNCTYDDLPRTVEHVDLKGSVAKGYALTHPKDEYVVQNDVKPAEVSEAILREFPVFRESSKSRSGSEPSEPVVTEDEMRLKTSPPCLKQALNDDSEFAEQLVSSVKYGVVDKLPVHRVLSESEYPEDTNTSAPPFLHQSPSETGTNFRVDSGAETFRCWRHDVTGNAYHLLGVKHGLFECGDWAYENIDISEVRRIARENGILTDDDVITCETVENNGLCPFNCGKEHPFDGVVQ